MAKNEHFYCSVKSYLERNKPDILELFEHSCTFGSIGSSKGRDGTTLFLPDDKLAAKIKSLILSSDAEKFTEGAELLESLVVRECIATAADWRKTLVDARRPSRKFAFKNPTATSVELNGGARAEIDKSVKVAPNVRKPFAVWNIIDGLKWKPGDETAELERKKTKKGGYTPTDAETQKLRFVIGVHVENHYAAHVKSQAEAKKCGKSVPRNNMFLSASISLLCRIKEKHKEMFPRAISVCSFDVTDFYFLVEPHRSAGEYLIPDEIIEEWWSEGDVVWNEKKIAEKSGEILEYLRNIKNVQGAAFNKRADLAMQISRIRQDISANVSSRKVCLEIEKVYADFDETGKFSRGGISTEEVFPEEVQQYYKANPGLKLLQDDLRFFVFSMFDAIQNDIFFDFAAYNETLQIIGDALHAADAASRARERRIINSERLRHLIVPTEKMEIICDFLCSTMFAFFPLPGGEFSHEKQAERPSGGRVLWNISANLQKHARVVARIESAEQAEKDLSISREEIAKLKDWLQRANVSSDDKDIAALVEKLQITA